MNSGMAGSTMAPESSIQLPRGRMRVSRGYRQRFGDHHSRDAVLQPRPRGVEPGHVGQQRPPIPARRPGRTVESGRPINRAARSPATGAAGRRRWAIRWSSGIASSLATRSGRPRYSLARDSASRRRTGRRGRRRRASTFLESASRKRPSVARRVSDSCRRRMTMVDVAVVTTGSLKWKAAKGLDVDVPKSPTFHAVLTSPSMAFTGRDPTPALLHLPSTVAPSERQLAGPAAHRPGISASSSVSSHPARRVPRSLPEENRPAPVRCPVIARCPRPVSG